MQVQRQPGLPFILITVFLDTLSFGFVIPVLPALVATMAPDKQSQACWYGLLLGSFGLAQIFSAPMLGAISDRCGRRSVLLVSILTWILYTTFRFGWGPRENGLSLFVVGIASAVGQTLLLGSLLKKLGDGKTALLGLASSSVAYVKAPSAEVRYAN